MATATGVTMMVVLSLGSSVRLECDRMGAFVRLGRRELYARRYADAAPSWAWHRDAEGAFEVDAGRFRLTVSRVARSEAVAASVGLGGEGRGCRGSIP